MCCGCGFDCSCCCCCCEGNWKFEWSEVSSGKEKVDWERAEGGRIELKRRDEGDGEREGDGEGDGYDEDIDEGEGESEGEGGYEVKESIVNFETFLEDFFLSFPFVFLCLNEFGRYPHSLSISFNFSEEIFLFR